MHNIVIISIKELCNFYDMQFSEPDGFSFATENSSRVSGVFLFLEERKT